MKRSPEFINFLHKCLQKDPAARPSTAELLQHPFILKGMQKEKELQSLIVENIPILIEARKKKKEEEEKGGTSGSEVSLKLDDLLMKLGNEHFRFEKVLEERKLCKDWKRRNLCSKE